MLIQNEMSDSTKENNDTSNNNTNNIDNNININNINNKKHITPITINNNNTTTTTTSITPKPLLNKQIPNIPSNNIRITRHFGRGLSNIINNLPLNPSKNFLLTTNTPKYILPQPSSFPSSPFTPFLSPEYLYYSIPPEHHYTSDILSSLFSLEKTNKTYLTYRSSSPSTSINITCKERALLINEQHRICTSLHLSDKTLYLSVQILDMFLLKQKISSSYYLLALTTCVYIAAKVEEIYYPHIKEFIFIMKQQYTMNEVFKMEKLILTSIDYNVVPLNTYSFYEIASNNLHLNNAYHNLGKMLLEMSMYEYNLLKHKSSTIAITIIFMLVKIIHKSKGHHYELYDNDQHWIAIAFCNLFEYTMDNFNNINNCFAIMKILIDNIHSGIFQYVYSKYSSNEYGNVTNFDLFM